MDGFVVKLGKTNSDGGSSQHGGAASTCVQSPNDQDDWIANPANSECMYLVEPPWDTTVKLLLINLL
jgi:hypothetical protein